VIDEPFWHPQHTRDHPRCAAEALLIDAELDAEWAVAGRAHLFQCGAHGRRRQPAELIAWAHGVQAAEVSQHRGFVTERVVDEGAHLEQL
jgi:hypothetical protein